MKIERYQTEERGGLTNTVVGPTMVRHHEALLYWYEHRQKLQRVIEKCFNHHPVYRRLAVIGAGACQDFDLYKALKNPQIHQIDLIDLNEHAVREAVRRALQQTADVHHGLRQNPGTKTTYIDWEATMMLKGFQDVLERHVETEATKEHDIETREGVLEFLKPIFLDMERLIYDAELPEELRERADVVLSDCVFSQFLVAMELGLQEYMRRVLPPRQFRKIPFTEMWPMIKKRLPMAMYQHHLDTLMDMTAPGGRVILACDQITQKRVLGPDGKPFVAREVLRVHLYQGKLRRILREMFPRLEVEDYQEWYWNREPVELLKEGMIAEGEKIHTAVLPKQNITGD